MKLKALFITLLLFYFIFPQMGQNIFYQKKDKIYQLMELDSMPIFEGGYDSLITYVDRNFTFPEIYADASIQGRVICKFIVTESGKITNVKIIQGIDKELDEEVVRVIYSMPRWFPGKKNSQAVKSEYFLAIYCRLRSK